MEVIDELRFQLVLDATGQPLLQGDNALLQRKADGELVLISKDVVFEKFNINPTTSGNQDAAEIVNTDEVSRVSWTKTQILHLIAVYKANENKIKSTTIRNDKVWQIISDNIKTHTADKCRNKFKYLKKKYTEKKDNMSNRCTGAKQINFEFFNQMDDIFGQDHNIAPVAIASSSKGVENLDKLVTEEETCENITPVSRNAAKVVENKSIEHNTTPKGGRKRKATRPEPDLYIQIAREREEGRNRRHAESIAVLKEGIAVLKDLAKTLKSDKA